MNEKDRDTASNLFWCQVLDIHLAVVNRGGAMKDVSTANIKVLPRMQSHVGLRVTR